MSDRNNTTKYPYKHIIWDWNGTLLNDAWMCVMVINETLAKRNMPTIDQEHYQNIFSFPVIDYYRRLGFDFVHESFEIVGTEFIAGYETHKYDVTLQEGAEQVLQTLSEQGVSHSILSAYEQGTLDELVEHFGLTSRFINVVGLADHYAHSKLENGIKWIAKLPYKKSEILFVGDTVHDFEVAEAIGIDCILIPGGHQTRAKLEATGSLVLDGVKDLILKI